ncbi:hypothetical protein ACWIB8_03690 [Corynebacterium flavescens]
MRTPLESQILDDFEERLAGTDSIPAELVAKLTALTRSDRVPRADALLETIKTNVGDHFE